MSGDATWWKETYDFVAGHAMTVERILRGEKIWKKSILAFDSLSNYSGTDDAIISDTNWVYTNDPLTREIYASSDTNLPKGKAAVVGDVRNMEIYALAKSGKYEEIVAIVPTSLEVWRCNQIQWRLGDLTALASIKIVREENPDRIDFPKNEANLIVVRNLYSMMDVSQRKELSRKIGSALVSGGKAVIVVSTKGPLYNLLRTKDSTKEVRDGVLRLYHQFFNVTTEKYFFDLNNFGKIEQGFDFDPAKFKVETKQLTPDQATIMVSKN